MVMRHVRLASPSQLVLEVKLLEGQVKRAAVRAMRKTGQFGRTAVERTIAKTKPRPVASNTYRQGWFSRHIRRGAVLGNSARHSLFVEAGRRPGRRPPVEAILEWVRVKKIRPRGMTEAKKRGGSGPPSPSGVEHPFWGGAIPKPPKTSKPSRPSTSKPKRPQSAAAAGAAAARRRTATQKRKQKKAAILLQAQRGLAFMIAQKIGRRGTKGRWVLRRTMPKIGRFSKRQMRKELGRIM